MNKTSSSKLLVLLLLCLALASLVACQSVGSFFVGRSVEPNLRVPLTAASPQTGTWQTFDLTIRYSVRKHADSLDISGHAELGEHYQTLYTRLKRLDVYLFFLNSDAQVLETVALSSGLSSDINQQMRFNHSLRLPPGTTDISFGYRGEVTSLDSYASFDELP